MVLGGSENSGLVNDVDVFLDLPGIVEELREVRRISWPVRVPDAEQRLQGCRSSSMTGQLAAHRVHVLWEKYWLAAWQDE